MYAGWAIAFGMTVVSTNNLSMLDDFVDFTEPIFRSSSTLMTRPSVLRLSAKKNWMFVGSEHSGKSAEIIQSLTGTAKLNSNDPSA
jgi:hypothetical protein